MRSAIAAEWILSLATDRERASGIVGDLLEERGSRTAAWFWWSVLTTAGVHLWRDFCLHPWHTMGLVLRGVMAKWLYGALLGTLLGVARFHRTDAQSFVFAPWTLMVLKALVVTVVPFWVVWDTVRQSEGREVMVAHAMVVWSWLWCGIAHYLSALQVQRMGVPWPGIDERVTLTCVESIFVLSAAVLYRRRHLPVHPVT